jgi:hypothetical protein
MSDIFSDIILDVTSTDYIAPLSKERIILAFKRASPRDSCLTHCTYTASNITFGHVDIIIPRRCAQMEKSSTVRPTAFALPTELHADPVAFSKAAVKLLKTTSEPKCADCRDIVTGYIKAEDVHRREDRRQCLFDATQSSLHHRSYLAHASHGVCMVVDKPYDEYYEFYEVHVSDRRAIEVFCEQQILFGAPYRRNVCQSCSMGCTSWFSCLRSCWCCSLCFDQHRLAGHCHPKSAKYNALSTDDEDLVAKREEAERGWFCSEFIVAALQQTGEFDELLVGTPDLLFLQIAARFPGEMRRVHPSLRRRAISVPVAMRVVVEMPSANDNNKKKDVESTRGQLVASKPSHSSAKALLSTPMRGPPTKQTMDGAHASVSTMYTFTSPRSRAAANRY